MRIHCSSLVLSNQKLELILLGVFSELFAGYSYNRNQLLLLSGCCIPKMESYILWNIHFFCAEKWPVFIIGSNYIFKCPLVRNKILAAFIQFTF